MHEPRQHLQLKIFAVIFIALFFNACHSAWNARYKGAVQVGNHQRYCVIDGSQEVLEIHRFSHNPLIPFAYSGYAVLMEINATDSLGQKLQIPSDQIKARIFNLSHSGSDLGEVTGTVTIISSDEYSLKADVDLKSKNGSRLEQGQLSFETRKVTPCKLDLLPSPSSSSDSKKFPTPRPTSRN